MYNKIRQLAVLFLISAVVNSCGGGGGGGGGSGSGGASSGSGSSGSGGTTTPTSPVNITLTASEEAVVINTSIILTWSSANATSCTASDAWSGSKALSGSETITISMVGNTTFTLSCSASGGTSSSVSEVVEGYRIFSGVSADGYIRGAEVFVDERAAVKEQAEHLEQLRRQGAGLK